MVVLHQLATHNTKDHRQWGKACKFSPTLFCGRFSCLLGARSSCIHLCLRMGNLATDVCWASMAPFYSQQLAKSSSKVSSSSFLRAIKTSSFHIISGCAMLAFLNKKKYMMMYQLTSPKTTILIFPSNTTLRCLCRWSWLMFLSINCHKSHLDPSQL